MEAEQDNIEFGQSMQHLSKYELLRIIGRKRNRDLLPRISRPMSLAWAASIAVVVLIGVLSVMRIHTADLNRLDNTIVAYNYIPDSNRGWESIAPSDIPSLVKAYQQAPADDVQAQQDAGMRLAMAYLKVHDRRKAKQTLTELAERFAFDEEFAAQCQRILSQLK